MWFIWMYSIFPNDNFSLYVQGSVIVVTSKKKNNNSVKTDKNYYKIHFVYFL